MAGDYGYKPVTPLALKVGDKVKMRERTRWTVKAVTENFVALTQQIPFSKAGKLRYTVIDWRNGVRGACNQIGQGYGDGTYSEAVCAEMLTEFEYDPETCPVRLAALAAGKTSWPGQPQLEISHRNHVPIDIEGVEASRD